MRSSILLVDQFKGLLLLQERIRIPDMVSCFIISNMNTVFVLSNYILDYR